MDDNDQKAHWNDRVSLWPKRETFTQAVTPLLIDHAQLQHGDHVLDIGSGGGLSTFAAAEVVGESGEVVGADVADKMTDLANSRLSGVGNVRFVTCDLEKDAVPGGPFDAAISQFGVMFFHDPVRAFHNISSQLRPGGWFTFVSWQGLEKNPWMVSQRLQLADSEVARSIEVPGVPGPFALSDSAQVDDILCRAGFGATDLTVHEVVCDIALDALVDVSSVQAMAPSPHEAEALMDKVTMWLQPFVQPSGLYRCPLRVQVFRSRAEAN